MSAEFDERVMTIPLRDVLAESTGQRADKAMSLIREHLARHFDVDEADVRLDPSVNEAVWERGRSKPPSELRVRAARFEEDGESVVEAEPA
ncbi:50S ribosomal protein L31e [Halobacteriales archaeon SW_12_69_24]|nr:MAG: 50S ribosomal protein L31e [Halobacteriales archaeon SW_12_69_24]